MFIDTLELVVMLRSCLDHAKSIVPKNICNIDEYWFMTFHNHQHLLVSWFRHPNIWIFVALTIQNPGENPQAPQGPGAQNTLGKPNQPNQPCQPSDIWIILNISKIHWDILSSCTPSLSDRPTILKNPFTLWEFHAAMAAMESPGMARRAPACSGDPPTRNGGVRRDGANKVGTFTPGLWRSLKGFHERNWGVY